MRNDATSKELNMHGIGIAETRKFARYREFLQARQVILSAILLALAISACGGPSVSFQQLSTLDAGAVASSLPDDAILYYLATANITLAKKAMTAPAATPTPQTATPTPSNANMLLDRIALKMVEAKISPPSPAPSASSGPSDFDDVCPSGATNWNACLVGVQTVITPRAFLDLPLALRSDVGFLQH